MESTASPNNNTEAAAVHIPPRPPSPNNVSTQDTGGSRGGTNANDTAAPLEHEFPQEGLRGLDDDDPPIPPLQVTDHVKEMEGPRLHDGPPEPPHFSHEYDDSIAKSVGKEGPRLIDGQAGPADPPYFSHEHDDSISKGLRNEVERNSSDHPRGSKDYTAHSTEEASAANEETWWAPTVEGVEEGGVSFQETAPPLGPLAEAAVSFTAEGPNSPSAGRSTFIAEAWVEDTEESPGRGTVYEAELIEAQVPHVVPVASEAVPPFYQRKGFVFVVITAALLAIGVVVGVPLSDNSDGITDRVETSSDDPLTGRTTLSPTSKTTNILTDPPTKTTDNPTNRPTKPPVQTTNNPSNWPTKPPTVLTVESSQKLLAPDGVSSDCFGRSVAMYGDTIVVSAECDDDYGDSSGAAHVFVRSGEGWQHQAKLLEPGGAAYDYFGARCVAIHGDTIVVPAPWDDASNDLYQSGSVHVFVRSGEEWKYQAKLLAPDEEYKDFFGICVAIYGDTIVASASKSGPLHVFVRSGGVWKHEAKLAGGSSLSELEDNTKFAIYEDTIVVGAVSKNYQGLYSGSAHVFFRSGESWKKQAKLLAPERAAFDGFGTSVAIYEDTIVVGADGDGGIGPSNGSKVSGSAHVFVRSGEEWKHQAKLLVPDGAAVEFGASVAIYGNAIVVGFSKYTSSTFGSGSGSANVYVRSGEEWTHQAKLLAQDDWPNVCVAIYENTIAAADQRNRLLHIFVM